MSKELIQKGRYRCLSIGACNTYQSELLRRSSIVIGRYLPHGYSSIGYLHKGYPFRTSFRKVFTNNNARFFFYYLFYKRMSIYFCSFYSKKQRIFNNFSCVLSDMRNFYLLISYDLYRFYAF